MLVGENAKLTGNYQSPTIICSPGIRKALKHYTVTVSEINGRVRISKTKLIHKNL